MEIFIVDAFTDRLFGGNQAGVALLGEDDPFPEAAVMQKIAAELKHSETAFVKAARPNTFVLRYFTPEGEVELCGHATVSAFTVLREEKGLEAGAYAADTMAGSLSISVERERIWMEMAPGRLLNYLSAEDSAAVYRAYGLDITDRPPDIPACIVSTGLPDILLPVKSRAALDRAVQNSDEIVRISKQMQVVGVHMFCCEVSPEVTAYCRNFAPLYGINEEAATGTSNGALTYYLLNKGLVREEDINVFVQGMSMGRPSAIYSKINGGRIYIGGEAVISVSGDIRL